MARERMFKTILLPMDGSAASFKAARYAIKIAKMNHSKLIALHAIAISPISRKRKKLVSSYYKEAERSAEEWMKRVEGIARKEGVKVEKNILTNVCSISYSVVDYAKKRNADLIVMGTRGRSGISRFMIGSIAHGVLTLSSCPVMVVR